MIGYAVKHDGSWRCIDTESMPLDDGETFQTEKPPETEICDLYESKRNPPA